MRTRPLASAVGLVALLIGLAGCGSDADSSTTTTTTTTTVPAAPEETTTTARPEISATTPPDVPTTTPEPDGRAAALDLYRELRDEHCTDAPTPEPVAVEPAAEGFDRQVVIVDAEDDRLVLDVDDRVVHSIDGPEGVLPPAYSFGCDPEVFVGTLDH